jgi:hypothetical protein
MLRTSLEDDEKMKGGRWKKITNYKIQITIKKIKKPQITQITQIFFSCFLCVSWIIFIAVTHDAAPSPGNEW